MIDCERPMGFHPQDWIIIIEALAQWAGPPEKLECERKERAYELIESIAAEHGLPPRRVDIPVKLENEFPYPFLKVNNLDHWLTP